VVVDSTVQGLRNAGLGEFMAVADVDCMNARAVWSVGSRLR
jgi:hypothetical protein